MESTALYRKYRPVSFGNVVGQEAIVAALEAAIKRGSVAHAYIFAGSRGIGKTSIARIFANELGTAPEDVYEIDAASNRGIDDVREIREGVSASPFRSKYKVYIVDEVHMLTKEAFNALLKTLEEPPAHAVFILATTELNKVPDTVISRCQVFQFKKPTVQILKDVVTEVGKKEGAAIDASSAELIALLGDGSFRDTLGTLQKVLTVAGGKKVSIEDVERATGAPRAELVNRVVGAVVAKDLEDALEGVNMAAKGNIDMKVFLKLVLQKMRYALLLRFAPKMRLAIAEELSEGDFDFVDKLAQDKAAHLNSQVLLGLLEAYDTPGPSSIPELPLELALAKLLGEEKAS
jgi:DNA polymerase-3 subunit gamma/tau